MSRSSSFVAALVCLALGACRSKPRDSAEFREAFALYNQLYAKSLDDAYGDPRMLHVADLLTKVDPASEQAGEAKDLLDKVNAGLTEAQARAKRVADDQKAASAPPKFTGSGAFEAPPKPKGEEAPSPQGPSLGMTRDEFTAKFGDCFERKGDFEQGEKRGEAFGLLSACSRRYPALTDSIVVLVDNKVVSLVPMKEITVRTVDAGAPPQAAVPVAAPVPPPPPPPVRYLPGAPHPEVPAEPAP